MAKNINISGNYGTHLGPLIATMAKTGGDVLELGMGVFSTPYLHYQCVLDKRHLTSYDNFPFWSNFFIDYGYQNPYHEIILIDNWAEAKIDKPWDVVLIDHTDDRRALDAKRLANLARYIIIHDSNDDRRHRRIFHYSDIYPEFKYKRVWDLDKTHATVLSNFVDLENLW